MEPAREFVVLDTETTGAPPGCRLVELGALLVRGRSVRERFESLLFPECPIPPSVTAVHGITDADVGAAPTAAEVLPGFLAWTRGLPLVAHNASFDAAVLAAECVRLRLAVPDNPLYCTLLGARRLLRARSYALESLVRQLELPEARHHRAADDAQHALHLLWRLQDGGPDGLPQGALGSGRPLSSYAPDPPRLPHSRRFLLEAAASGEAVELTYLLADGRVRPLLVTPRFFYRARGRAVMEGLCHADRHYKTYRMDRILAARPEPEAPPAEVRRPLGAPARADRPA